MSKQKLTPWFPEDMKPVRPGVYETEFDNTAGTLTWGGYTFWNGRRWGNQAFTRADAKKFARRANGTVQEKRWRGLASPGAQEGA